MSRELQESIDGGKTQTTAGPLATMAPESILRREYSTKSDIWAYGCLVIEIYNRGVVYDGLSLVQVAGQVATGSLRPKIPAHVPAMLHEVLNRCWSMEPSARPDMQEIVDVALKTVY